MTVLDLLLGALLLAAVAAGLRRGLLATVGALVGLAAGAVVAYWALPLVNDAVPSARWRGPVTLAFAVVLPLLGASAGAGVGHGLRRGVDRTPLRFLDRLLGGAAGLVAAAAGIALVGPAVVATGVPVVSPALASSTVLRTIDDLTPAPVARSLASLRAAALDDGLPRLGDLLVPERTPTVPPVEVDDPALLRAAASVARISGTAYACGTSATGSGFVVAEDRVVTNAHVVTGVDRPVVELPGRGAREGRLVYLDPVDDLAVVAVDDLGVPPLEVAPTLAAGARGAVQGYPYGGPFTSSGAEVLSVATAAVPDAYGGATADREIYALAADVRPGSSGGPVLSADGRVVGVVFARAESVPDLAYAMTTAELAPVAAQAADLDAAVPAGACAR